VTEHSEEQTGKRDGGRPRTWRRIGLLSLLIVTLVGTLLFFLPRILSISSVRRSVLAGANDKLAGRLEIAGWRLRWRHGLRFDGIVFSTSDGEITLSSAHLDVSAGLLSLVGRTNNFGHVRLVAPEIVVRAPSPDGGTRSGAATSRVENTGSRMAEAAEPDAAIPESTPQKERAAVPQSRDIVADISVSQGKLTVESREGSLSVLADIAASVRIDGLRKPVRFECKGTQGDNAGRISLCGELHLPSNGKIVPEEFRANAKLSVKSFDISALSAMTAAFEQWPRLQGRISSESELRLAGPGEMDLASRTEIAGFKAEGGVLGLDKPVCDRVVVECDAGVTNGTLVARKLTLESPFGHASIQGKLRLPRDGRVSQGDLVAKATAEVARLAGQLPQSMRLRPGLTVKDGRASIRGCLGLSPDETVFNVDIATTPIRAFQDTEPVGIDSPMELRAEGKIDAKGIDLKVLKLDTPFAAVSGQGNVTNLAVDLAVDLAAAQREAAKFVKLGNQRLAGELQSAIRMQSVSERESALSVIATVNNLHVERSTPRPFTQARVRSILNSRVAVDENGEVQGLSAIRLKCEADPIGAEIAAERLAWPIGARPFSLRNAACTITGDVGRIMAKAVEMGLVAPEPQRRMSGELSVSGRFSVASNVVDVADASATVTSLIYENGTAGVHEPEICIATSGTIAPETWKLKSIRIASQPFSLSATGRITDASSSAILELEGTAGTNLERVGEITAAFTDMEIEMAGAEEGRLRYRGPLRAGSGLDALRKADAEAAIHVKRLVWKGAEVQECRPVIRLKDGQLAAEARTSLNDGQLHLVSLVDFTKTPPLLEVPENSCILTDAKLDEALTGDLLAHVHPVLKGSAVLDGMVSVDMTHLRLPLYSNLQSEADFEGSLILTNVVLRPAALLGDILSACRATSTEAVVPYQPVRFSCRDGKLECDPLKIVTSKATIIVHGTVGLDGTLAYVAELPITEGMVSDRYYKYLKGVTLRVPIGGTIDHPRIDQNVLSGELAEQTAGVIKNYLKEEGAELLKKFFK